jgi:hypothetical protein
MLIKNAKVMKGFLLWVFLISFILSCHESSHKNLRPKDKWSIWLVKNEDHMNMELNKKMVFEMQDIPKNAIYKSSTITVTKGDTTILGEFAKLFSDYSPCLLVSYTFITDTFKRKVITLYVDKTIQCTGNTDTILTIDSTKFFTIKKTSSLFGDQ